jgi:hypothetical protein
MRAEVGAGISGNCVRSFAPPDSARGAVTGKLLRLPVVGTGIGSSIFAHRSVRATWSYDQRLKTMAPLVPPKPKELEMA